MLTSSFKTFIRQNRLALYCFLLSALFFFLANLDMQGRDSGQLISISPFVGPEIDLTEYFHYHFYEIEQVNKKDFLSARVYQINEDLFQLQIELKGGKEQIKIFNKNFLALFQSNIQRFGKRLVRSFNDLETEMKEGRYPRIQVELTNEMKMLGKVLNLDEEQLSLRSELGVFDFPIETVKEITFIKVPPKLEGPLAYENHSR